MASGRCALPKAIDSSREALGTLKPLLRDLGEQDRHRCRVADAHVADHVPDPPPVAQARLVPLLVVQLVQVLADRCHLGEPQHVVVGHRAPLWSVALPSPPARVADHSTVSGHTGQVSGFDGLDGAPFGTVLADPPWRFQNRTGKVAPEHRRLSRYDTMAWKEIAALPVADAMAPASHCYLWVPNALLAEGLRVLEGWGFTYKTMLVWHKVRKDGGSDGRGVGFYFRNVTEPVLFGVRGPAPDR